jgi:hypothetical protein
MNQKKKEEERKEEEWKEEEKEREEIIIKTHVATSVKFELFVSSRGLTTKSLSGNPKFSH